MQSYEHHIVFESLQRRHPYLQEPFTSDLEPQQITVAIFDRMIPKFREVLIQEDLDYSRCRDALKTLNELVHQPEIMDKMIDYDLLQIAASLLKHQSWEVRTQAAILLSCFALSRRAREIFGYAFPMLQELLEDPVLPVREAVALTYEKLSVNDDGCTRIVTSKCAECMIESFIAHSKDEGSLKRDDGQYLIYLLEAFANLTFSDQGIEPLLGKSAVATLNNIISQAYVEEIMLPNHKQKIRELSLRVLGNISINPHGKQECIDTKVVLNAWKYLDSDHYQERLNASLVLLSCTIHLDGKKQAAQFELGGLPLILQKIIQRLGDMQEVDIRKNLKVTLLNIAELPEGFLKVCHELSDKMDLLDEVFGPRCVKDLHKLLPKLTEYPDPLHIDINQLKKYHRYVKSLAYIMKSYKDEAAQVAVDQTINFSEKLAPFINPETGL